jgi:hypothetical protein
MHATRSSIIDARHVSSTQRMNSNSQWSSLSLPLSKIPIDVARPMLTSYSSLRPPRFIAREAHLWPRDHTILSIGFAMLTMRKSARLCHDRCRQVQSPTVMCNASSTRLSGPRCHKTLDVTKYIHKARKGAIYCRKASPYQAQLTSGNSEL